ncbi:MAG: NADPH-dependent FMN reductase [Lonepinella koalarum]|nr:NADPH-dependent FMN reductase [Lonepinella koalarum]
MTKKIALLVGSGSSTSFSKLVAKHLQQLAPTSLQLDIVEIAHLPLYDRDLDANSPQSYEIFRTQIAQADAYIFITPEHNGSYSAMIKNAIDIGSRPMGQSLWIGKPAGIVSVGAGAGGGVRAADHLRVITSGSFINMPTAPFAANIGGLFNGAFDAEGNPSEAVAATLSGFIKAYADFVAKF